MSARPFTAVAIGCSAGGTTALRRVLPSLPRTFPLPIIVVMHAALGTGDIMAEVLGHECALSVGEAREKQSISPGHVHIAPGGYHLLVEEDRTLSLTIDPKVSNSRPSIDVLFASAADVYGEGLIGVILTGANSDGSNGLRAIRDAGGLGIVQDPATAEASAMPLAAIAAGGADRILPVEGIPACLIALAERGR
ncbi:MAG: chemotaxis protein CheB [Alphaproteobacteria bacterium]|nr:chemotaxis protein CheB [Alphaproteobacteria bacterium]